MANPVLVACPEGQWTKVATNVVTGKIWRKNSSASYFHTYRETGDAAPTAETEKAQIFVNEESLFEDISAQSAIDVYIWCDNSAGRVRVDL